MKISSISLSSRKLQGLQQQMNVAWLVWAQLHVSHHMLRILGQMGWLQIGKQTSSIQEHEVCTTAGLQKEVRQTSVRKGSDVFDPALSRERNKISS